MSPTLITPAMTQVGVIMGTAAYMSPEQARGRAVDRRADVWAFGAVLFEMVSGRRAFSGENVSETLAEVMKSEPPWQSLPVTRYRRISCSLIRQCLVKDPRQRIRDMGDVRLALEGAFETTEPPTAVTSALPDCALDAHRRHFSRGGCGRGRGGRCRCGRVDAVAYDACADVPPSRGWPCRCPTTSASGAWPWKLPLLAVRHRGRWWRTWGANGREQIHVRAIDGVESKALDRYRAGHQSFLLSRWRVDRVLRPGKAEKDLSCGRDDPDVVRRAQRARWKLGGRQHLLCGDQQRWHLEGLR